MSVEPEHTPPVPRRRLHAPEAQAVTFVELFFDLVFVFAVTQVTSLTAANLDASGIARSLLLFWLIWWAWTQFTWTLNPADTNHDAVRILTLVATGAAFLMAASTTRAFGSDALWFAVPYLVVRLLGLALQVRIDVERDAQHRTVFVWVAMSLVGLALVLLGALVEPPSRNWIWLLAIGADLAAAGRASRGQWDIAPAHFSERHGLFVIIALGESLIVAAAAVSAEPRTAALVIDTVGALVVAGLLWWSYFGWLKDGLEQSLEAAGPRRVGTIASTAFSIGHFPVICGIIAFAVALDDIVHHPAHVPPTSIVAALGAGVVLFVGCSALAYWRASGVILVPRLALLAATGVGLLAVSSLAPGWQLTVLAAGLLAIVLVEGHGPKSFHDARLDRGQPDGDLPITDE